jgi:disulfide bond formation protein DsbB
MKFTPRLLYGSAVLLPLLAVAAAVVSQHQFNMQPCPWCVLQRVIFIAIALAALPGLLLTLRPLRLLSSAVGVGLAACGAAAALWQHFVAAASASCNMTLADKIVGGLGLDGWQPELFEARASCADAAVNLLGLPYEFWSLALFVMLAAALVGAARRPALRA